MIYDDLFGYSTIRTNMSKVNIVNIMNLTALQRPQYPPAIAFNYFLRLKLFNLQCHFAAGMAFFQIVQSIPRLI